MDIGILVSPFHPPDPPLKYVRDAEGHLAIHYSELRPLESGHPLYEEWELYRREVARLIAGGQEGKHVLIRGDQIIGIWDARDEANQEGLRRYLLQPYLVHQIRLHERVYRTGFNRLCRT
jgi:hypothetical protein